MYPPTTGPIIGAMTITIPNTAIAIPLFSLGNASSIMACDIGSKLPPPKPWTILASTIEVKEVDIPQKNDAAINISKLIQKKFFLPNNLQKKSTEGIATPDAIR